ncbi:MAG: hypothetical protein RL299_175 [Pseudomonadota bacterium]|jgi:hypothetical protein
MNTITRPEAAALAEVPAYNPPAPAAGSTSSIALLMDDRSMDKLIRMADMMSTAKATVPAHFRGSAGDCLAVCMQAATWGMNPFAVAQKTHLVGGTLGYEAQLVAAVINNSGVVQDRFHYEWFGKWESNGKTDRSRDNGVKIWATLKGETDPRELTVTMAEAGVRNSPLWEQAPKIQLSYLAAKRWARLYAPDVILGVYTPDEFEQPAPRDMGRAQVVQSVGLSPELIERAEAAASQGMKAYQQFWGAITPADRKALTGAGEHDRLKDVATKIDAARTVDTSSAFPPMSEQPAGKSFEEIMQMLCSAKTEDALYVAADWISGDDQEQVKLLDAKFKERLAQIRGEA